MEKGFSLAEVGDGLHAVAHVQAVKHLALVQRFPGHQHVTLVVFDEEDFDGSDGFSQHRRWVSPG